MKLNPETFATASSRHPWRTLGIWLVVIVGAAFVSARLLTGVLTDQMSFNNNPESVRAQEVIDERFGNSVGFTEFLVVQSDTMWDEDYSAFVRELEADVGSLGPDVVAAPPTSYADAEAALAQMFTLDGHGVLVLVQLREDPGTAVARLDRRLGRTAPEGFEARVLTSDEMAELMGPPDPEAPPPADPPEAVVLVSHPYAVTGNLQFLNAVRSVEATVTRVAGSALAAPPTSGFDAQQQAGSLIALNRRTTLIAVPIVEQTERVVEELRAVARRASNEAYTVQVAGQAALFADMMRLVEEDMRKSESIGLGVALIVLIVVFGSILAAVLPLVMGLFAIAVALGLVALVGQLFEFSLFVESMITMVGLAVGIDYSLFIVSRYREERKKGFDKLEAIRRSGATANRAVFFSGLTVVLALLGMLIIPVSIFRSLAGGAILVTLAAIAASMTLLPAVLALLGDRVNWPRLSKRARLETSHDPQGGFWDRMTRRVMARPVTFLVASVLLLGTLGAFFFQLHRGTTQNVSALPEEFPSRQAFLTLVRDFGSGGATDPAQVLIVGDVASPEIQEAVTGLQRSIAEEEVFSGATTSIQSKPGTELLLSVYFAGDPYNDAAFDGIRELRTTLVPQAFGAVDGVEVLVGGNSGLFVDFLSIVDTYQWVVLVFVLGLSFLLLTVVFRSIVVPIKAIVMNLLSVAAAYGAVTLVFQEGFGIGFFNAIGLPFKQVEAIEAWLPLFLFSILFGLSMDYHVFLLSRIREEYDKTGDNTEAVAYGLRTTAGIITGAALIMVTVFGAFAAGRVGQFQQMGFGLAIAVLMDATIVRTILVPASMRLLGDWNWYLPRWLQWLPELHVEGAEAPPTPTPAPAMAMAPVPEEATPKRHPAHH